MKKADYSAVISFNGNSITSLGGDTLSKCLEQVFTTGTYHAKTYDDIFVTIHKVCKTCEGIGTIPKKRGLCERKPCKDCKEQGSETVAAFPLNVYHGMIVVENDT